MLEQKLENLFWCARDAFVRCLVNRANAFSDAADRAYRKGHNGAAEILAKEAMKLRTRIKRLRSADWRNKTQAKIA